ncbi:DUF2357 domain-containing protein [Microvirga arabica]|uniref:DUF2357 domain-containing protein n=1 Tax=Microvirga arabica TaxID=1128671 RepID=A0ABV6Y3G0_9HYPH
MVELWRRPWALTDLARRHRMVLSDGSSLVEVDADHQAALWLYAREGGRVIVDGRPETAEPVPGFSLAGDGRVLVQLPLPLRRSQGPVITDNGRDIRILRPFVPDRPPAKSDPQTDEEMAAHRVLLRAMAVWDRLRDVDTALADPAHLWEELRQRWTEQDDVSPPKMDIIVRHAAALSRTLDELDRAPRRILRRTHQQVPISRVQELDRRAMTWLVRQPGETLAERAGDRQRILAVAREENFDTLENRVLRAYAELARQVARDYLERNRRKQLTSRARKVEEFGRRCRRLARDLADRGVRLAEPGVTPNFVLQQNARYHKVWTAWLELLEHNRILDELWRWQARSWEEFCTLAVMVSLISVPGAQLVASAPLTFLDEQRRGSWIQHDNPLAAIYLPKQGVVVEVRYRMTSPDRRLSDYAAPIWIRYGRAGDVGGFLHNIAVWPMWDMHGGLVNGEAAEIADIIRLGWRAGITAGLVLRPPADNEQTGTEDAPHALVTTIGTDGPALWEGIKAIERFLSSYISVSAS